MKGAHALVFFAALGGLAVLVAGLAVGSSGNASRTEARWVITDLGAGIAVDINERGQVVGGGAYSWLDGNKTPMGTRGGPSSCGAAINDQAQVIGGSLTRKPARGHAFFWQDGKMTDLGTLGGRRSGARAINERGQVVGSSTTASGREHAFLWQNGKMRDLGTLGGPSSIAFALNERGQVAGSSETPSGHQHAFLWQKGKMRDLGTLGGAYAAGSSAVDINERGQIVGSSYSATISYGQLGAGVHAFLWQNGKMRDLGTLGRNPPTSTAVAINDRGEVIGNSSATGDWRPFLWRNGKMINLGTLPGGSHSEAVAINNRGQVIGDSIPRGPHGMSHAFVWQNGTMADLGTLGGFVSVPTAINEHDQIVGGSNTTSGKGRAVLWTLKRET
jgi:probable HAF family extracellular repeat protein